VEKGYAVRAIRRQNKLPFFISPDILNKVEWVPGDVLDMASLEDAAEGIDTIIHSAAMVSFLAAERRQMYKTNVEGTANMVNIALDKNIQRFVHISSVAALGRTANAGIVTEQRLWEESKVNTHYAISKYHAEMEVWRGMGEGLDTVILNPGTVLGFGDWHSSSCAIFKTVYNEFPWYTTGINGFVAVEDVSKATVALMESAVRNERFIITGDNWSFKQLLDTIADGFHKKKPAKEATAFLGEMAWRIEKIKAFFSGKKPLLTKESARVAHSKTHFDNSKILNTLPGFSFTPLQNAIKSSCKKYLDHNSLTHSL
jgi:dihydroflavonol-4-reductase